MSFEDAKPAHAQWSPSGADRWMVCTASIALGENEPDTSSEYADEGTAAHWLAAYCLTNNDDPARYLDRKIMVVNGVVWAGGDAPKPARLKGRDYDIEREFVVDSDMVMHVRRYVQNIRDYAKGNTLYVEQQLPIGHLTGEEGATGTGDVVILTGDGVEIQAHDLKFGRGVEVSAENNRQMKIYGLGALHKFGEEMEAEHGKLPTRFRAVIHQPRSTDAPKEWDCSIEELVKWGVEEVMPKAQLSRANMGISSPPEAWVNLVPGEKQCRFCKAKAICPALAKFVEENVGADFEVLDAASQTPPAQQHAAVEAKIEGSDLTLLGVKARAYDLIEMWGKAVRAKIEHVLLESRNQEGTIKALGFKLVQGKRGNRKWKDDSAVEAMLKKMRFKQEEMYDFSLKSPPVLEKQLKENPKRWAKLQEHITQSPGQPHVAPLDDKRPVLQMADPADDFDSMVEAHVDAKPLNHTDEDDFSDIA